MHLFLSPSTAEELNTFRLQSTALINSKTANIRVKTRQTDRQFGSDWLRLDLASLRQSLVTLGTLRLSGPCSCFRGVYCPHLDGLGIESSGWRTGV